MKINGYRVYVSQDTMWTVSLNALRIEQGQLLTVAVDCALWRRGNLARIGWKLPSLLLTLQGRLRQEWRLHWRKWNSCIAVSELTYCMLKKQYTLRYFICYVCYLWDTCLAIYVIFGILAPGKKGEAKQALMAYGVQRGFKHHQLIHVLVFDACLQTCIDFMHREMLGMVKLVYPWINDNLPIYRHTIPWNIHKIHTNLTVVSYIYIARDLLVDDNAKGEQKDPVAKSGICAASEWAAEPTWWFAGCWWKELTQEYGVGRLDVPDKGAVHLPGRAAASWPKQGIWIPYAVPWIVGKKWDI